MCTKQVLLSPRACVYTCVWVCVLSNPNVWATGCYINGLMTLPCQKEDMCSTPPYWWMDRTVGELRETDWFMGPFKGNLLSVSLPLHRCKCWWPTWTSDFKGVKDRRAADTGSQWFSFFFFFFSLNKNTVYGCVTTGFIPIFVKNPNSSSPWASSSCRLPASEIPNSRISHLGSPSCSLITHSHLHIHIHRLTAKWLFIKDRDLRGSNRLRVGNCVSH